MIRIVPLGFAWAVATCAAAAPGDVVRGGPYVDRSVIAPASAPGPAKSMLDMPLPPPVPNVNGTRPSLNTTTGIDPDKLRVIGITGRRVLLRYERSGGSNNDIGTANRSSASDSSSGGQLRVQRGITIMVRHGEPVLIDGQSYVVSLTDDTVNLHIVQGKHRDLVWSGQIEGQPYTDIGPSSQTFTPPLSVGAEFTKDASSNAGSSLGQSNGYGTGGASPTVPQGSTGKR